MMTLNHRDIPAGYIEASVDYDAEEFNASRLIMLEVWEEQRLFA